MSYGSPAAAREIEALPQESPPRPRKELTVCHLISGDLWAGAEAQAAALLGALARKRRFRLSAILLNEGRLAEKVRKCGVEVEVISESTHSFIEIVKSATAYLRPRQVQILHSHRYKENLLAALLSRRCRIPFIVRTEHGAPEPFQGLRQVKHRVMRQLDRLVARYATDRVISVSSELKQHLARYVNPRKIAVISNGLDMSSVRSELSACEAKRRLNLPANCQVVGYAGRLAPVKRLDIFLAAAKEISSRRPETQFVIVGEGSEELRLRQIAAASGLSSRVLFPGHQDGIYDVLRAFDIFVLCSDHEGLPMVLLEALHLGIPVVARPVGGIPEAVQDGVNGLLVDSTDPLILAEACLRILTDSELRTRLAETGCLRVAETFSAEKTADTVGDLYLSLCQRGTETR